MHTYIKTLICIRRSSKNFVKSRITGADIAETCGIVRLKIKIHTYYHILTPPPIFCHCRVTENVCVCVCEGGCKFGWVRHHDVLIRLGGPRILVKKNESSRPYLTSQAYLAIHTSRLMPFTSQQRTEAFEGRLCKNSIHQREDRQRKRIKCNQIFPSLFQKTPQFAMMIKAKH